MAELNIRRAVDSDSESITAIAIQSKAHWGYTSKQMETFRSELTLTPEMLSTRQAFVAEEGGALCGYYSLVSVATEVAELEHMFVAPDRLYQGIGTRLFTHAVSTATDSGFRRLVIQSDPNARGFYVKRGAALLGEIPSSIPNRTIPRFVFELG